MGILTELCIFIRWHCSNMLLTFVNQLNLCLNPYFNPIMTFPNNHTSSLRRGASQTILSRSCRWRAIMSTSRPFGCVSLLNESSYLFIADIVLSNLHTLLEVFLCFFWGLFFDTAGIWMCCSICFRSSRDFIYSNLFDKSFQMFFLTVVSACLLADPNYTLSYASLAMHFWLACWR